MSKISIKLETIVCPIFCLLCLLSLYGCGAGKSENYYQQVLEMEEEGEQIRNETGRRPEEVVKPVIDPEPVEVPDTPGQQVAMDEPQEEAVTPTEKAPVEEETSGTKEVQEKPPQRKTVRELSTEPIALETDVIKSALKSGNLNINIRTVELLSGRLTGGKNSARVYFIPESVNAIDETFGSICAVLYYLDSESNTVDIVAGIAEDEQSNLLAILQSNMEDITAWMNNEISRAEWYSRITKKSL